jgi:hypothetical protein
MILESKHRGNGKAVYERATDKDALQEIVHRARLTTLSLSYPYATKDRTKPYLAKQVKDRVKDYKGSRHWTYRSQRFSSEVVLYEGLYCGRKGKRYATEVVTKPRSCHRMGFEGRLR